MSKNIFGILALLLLSFAVSAQEATEAPVEAWECPDGYAGESLDIFGWIGYDTATAVFDGFEAACDVTVSYVTYDDEFLMRDAMRLGNPGHDLLILSGTMVEVLSQEGLAVELDQSLIPNQANVLEQFLAPEYDPENAYSFPYSWGSVGVMYRTEAFPDGIDSWDDVWAHDGSVIWINDARAMLGVGLQMLGYDANSDNASEISEARDYLAEQGGNLLGISDPSNGLGFLENEEADVVIVYSGTASRYLLACECDTYAYAIPNEGSNVFIDNMLVPVDSEDPELGMVFMDYVLHPLTGAAIGNRSGGGVNAVALDLGLVDATFSGQQGFNLSEEVFANMFPIDPLDDDTVGYYQVAWNDLLLYFGTYPE